MAAVPAGLKPLHGMPADGPPGSDMDPQEQRLQLPCLPMVPAAQRVQLPHRVAARLHHADTRRFEPRESAARTNTRHDDDVAVAPRNTHIRPDDINHNGHKHDDNIIQL